MESVDNPQSRPPIGPKGFSNPISIRDVKRRGSVWRVDYFW